jgi:hypothetical protein
MSVVAAVGAQDAATSKTTGVTDNRPARFAATAVTISGTINGGAVEFPVDVQEKVAADAIKLLGSCAYSDRDTKTENDLKKAREQAHLHFSFAKPRTVTVQQTEVRVPEMVITLPLSTGAIWVRANTKVLYFSKYSRSDSQKVAAWLEKAKAPPADLKEQARKFLRAPNENRYEIGEAIFRLLPRCPVTWRKEIGTGTLVSYDYSSPTYFLFKRDVIRLLGSPDTTDEDNLTYTIERKEGMLWCLWIHFQSDHVVLSTILGTLEKDADRTPKRKRGK